MHAIDDILGRLGLDRALLADGDLEVRTPITGEPLARMHRTRRRRHRRRRSARGSRGLRGLARRARAAARRARAAARRGAAAREGRARRARHARDRQDRAGGPRRGAGDDRHLRLRGRPVAPALRPHDRIGAAGPPDARDVASARPGRRRSPPSTSRSRCGAGTPRSRSSAATPSSGSRRERTPLTALACQALFRRAAAALGDAPDGLLEVVIGGADRARQLADGPASAARLRHRLDRHGQGALAAGRRAARPLACSSSAATTAWSSRRAPTSTSPCAPSCSAPSAPPASAAPPCAA